MPPEPTNKQAYRKRLGRCWLDQHLAHATYSCARYAAKTVTPETLGLEAEEIAWCRAHPADRAVQRMAELYRGLKADPHDEPLRELFNQALFAWRDDRSRLRVTC